MRECREPDLRVFAHFSVATQHVQPLSDAHADAAGARGGAIHALPKLPLTDVGGEIEIANGDPRGER